MAEIKLFHKILIVIAALILLPKLMDLIKLPKFTRDARAAPPRTWTPSPPRCEAPVAREPERRTVVREYVPVPVQMPTVPQAAPPAYVPQMAIPTTSITFEEEVPKQDFPNTITISDRAFQQCYG
jgi:hypothetical protein